MKHLPAALLAATVLSPALAWAQSYPLDKVHITGNVSVPSATLNAVVTEKPGTTVTKDDILADQDAIVGAYKKANVGMSITVLLATNQTNHHVEVTFKIDEKAAPPPQTVTLENHIAHVYFVGNKVETTEALLAATHMKPGDVVTNDTLKAAQASILDVYQKDKTAKLGNVNIEGSTAAQTPGQVDITWKITETAGKKKKRNTEDPGGQAVDQ